MTQAETHLLCGSAAADFNLLDWFFGTFEMGDGRDPVSLRGLVKWKNIMQFGEAEEQLDALTPTCNETIDQMLMRVPLPLEAPTPDTHPEWYARHQADSQLWTTH